MAVQVAANQAVLTIDEAGAKPDFAFTNNNTFLLGHLTTGFSGTDFVGDAITCNATVPVSGPLAEVSGLELGFVQIAEAESFQAFYGGRIVSEGGIALNYFVPPALSNTVLIDGTTRSGGTATRDPWYRNPVFGTGAGGRRAADTGDHPGMVVRLSLENRSRSNVRNFLFHCFMDRKFWTVLTALEAGGKLQYIAHFHWQVRYEFRLKWKDGNPRPPISQSFVRVLRRQTAGRPTEPDLQTLLNAPAGERANSVGKRAEAATVTGVPPNRTDNKTRFITMPDDFWS